VLDEKSGGMGSSHGEDGIRKAAVVGKGRGPLRKSAMGIFRERK
jgi:hypothetical protein